jgi:hypothetical protein
MKVQDQLTEMQANLKEIKEALLGNEYVKQGLVHRVEEHQKYIDKDNKFKWTVAGILIGVAATKDYIITFIKSLI